MAGMLNGPPGPPGAPSNSGMPPLDGSGPYTPYMFELVDAVRGLYYWTTLSRVELAASALFLYDYLLTIGMEIDLVWYTKWNYIKILYIVQRYMPFMDAGIVTIYRHAGTNFTGPQCYHMTMITAVFTISGTIASEILLTIRVWALWNRGKSFAIGLFSAFTLVWAPAIAAGYLYTSSLIYPETPLYDGFHGCFIAGDKPLVVWCWLALLVWDLVSLIMVIIPGINTYRAGISNSTRLTYVVYRDGTIYYAFLFVMSLLNIGFSAALPASSRVVTMALTRCLHSMLASRVLLQLREQSHSTDDLSLSLGSTFFSEDGGAGGFGFSERDHVNDGDDDGDLGEGGSNGTRRRNPRRSYCSESI